MSQATGPGFERPALWRLRFVQGEEERPAGAVLLCSIDYPDPIAVLATSVDVDPGALPAPRRDAASAPLCYDVVTLPAGAATPFDLQKDVENWVNDPAGVSTVVNELALRSGRLLWRADRALLVCSGDQGPTALVGLACLIWMQAAIAAVERRIHHAWPRLDAHAGWLGKPDRLTRAQRQEIVAAAVEAGRLRLWFVRATHGVERTDAVAPAAARRVFWEMTLQADLANRLKLIDDAIEAMEDLSATLNEQDAEYRYFRSSYIVEILIIVAIVAEAAVVIWDMMR